MFKVYQYVRDKTDGLQALGVDIYAGVVALWVIVFRMLSWRRKVLGIILRA